MKKIPKTNACRLLDTYGIPYTLHKTPVSAEDLSSHTLSQSLASALGAAEEHVFKTLVCRGETTGILLVCIPSNTVLDRKALAAHSGNKSVDMVPVKEIVGLTGYVRGGCSPLAAKKNYPVFLDARAEHYARIFVSAGQRGLTLELAPADLIKATAATCAPLACPN